MKNKLLIALCLFSFSVIAAPLTNEDANAIKGVWLPGSGKAHVKIEKIGPKFYGKVIWLKEPIDPETKKPKTDKNNPSEQLQSIPLMGLRLLKDFTYAGDKKWKDGTIYDPENGKTYSCNITMKDENTLNIRGYIGISAIGRTDVWTRVK